MVGTGYYSLSISLLFLSPMNTIVTSNVQSDLDLGVLHENAYTLTYGKRGKKEHYVQKPYSVRKEKAMLSMVLLWKLVRGGGDSLLKSSGKDKRRVPVRIMLPNERGCISLSLECNREKVVLYR